MDNIEIRWGDSSTNFIFNDRKAFDFYKKWGDEEHTLIYDPQYHCERNDAYIYTDMFDKYHYLNDEEEMEEDEHWEEFKSDAREAGLWSEEEMDEAVKEGSELYLPSAYVDDDELEKSGVRAELPF